ncbi:MAG: hypothetical protein IJ157_08935 [Clostridia bacterium]|nr:hypothetical protein [Clostridia bacterium]
MTEKEKDLIVKDDQLPAVDEETGKKTGLVRGARDFIENTFATLKGKDMNQAVEEFTSEMTLVAEGLSEDQALLRQDVDKLSAQQTLLEEKVLRGGKENKTDLNELRDAVKQSKKQAEALEKRLDGLEKTIKEAEKKPAKMGLGQILRQATWMVGIICGAWVIVTVLKLLGR